MKDDDTTDLFDTPPPPIHFSEPKARRTDPDTSHLAAKRMKLMANDDRRLVLVEHYCYPDGLTDFEVAANLGRLQTSLGMRRNELCEVGLIEKTPIRRPTPSGSPAIVWRITEAGQEYILRKP
jgi:hypothetical protein